MRLDSKGARGDPMDAYDGQHAVCPTCKRHLRPGTDCQQCVGLNKEGGCST